MRTPICLRALGLLLLDWSLEVLNHSPGSIQARWETLSVQQDSCLWWRVRVTDTAPNAPNAPRAGNSGSARCILSTACNLPDLGEKPVASVVWR